MSPRDLFDTMNGHSFDDDDKVQKVKLHDLEMALHYDTGKAVLVSDTGEESRAVWLPKSQVEIKGIIYMTPLTGARESTTLQG